MNINLHIERLVLNGLPVTASDGVAIQAELEAELTRLLGTHGLRGLKETTLRNLSHGQINIPAHSDPKQTGRQIANAVYSGVGSLRPAPRAAHHHGGKAKGVRT